MLDCGWVYKLVGSEGLCLTLSELIFPQVRISLSLVGAIAWIVGVTGLDILGIVLVALPDLRI